MWSWGPRWVCRDPTEGTLQGLGGSQGPGRAAPRTRTRPRQAALTGDGMTGEDAETRHRCVRARALVNTDLLSGGTLSLCGHPDRLR